MRHPAYISSRNLPTGDSFIQIKAGKVIILNTPSVLLTTQLSHLTGGKGLPTLSKTHNNPSRHGRPLLILPRKGDATPLRGVALAGCYYDVNLLRRGEHGQTFVRSITERQINGHIELAWNIFLTLHS